MASAGVSQLILFIAAITITAGVATTLSVNVAGIGSAIDARGVDLAHEIGTEVVIVSDPGSDAVYDPASDRLVLLVKNTGDTTLRADPAGIDLLVDGEYVVADEVTVVTGDEWRPGDVVRVVVTTDLAPGTHRVSLHVGGDRDTLEVRV
jgi:flagellar protein FlaG